MPDPRVTVAVIQRETFGHTKRSLDSLYATAGAPFELIYIDCGSPPKVQRLIEAESRRRGFKVLRSERFCLPNAARNIALAAVETEFVVLVDNDTIFKDAWLERLLVCADETGADVVGPLIYYDEPLFQAIHYAGGEARIEQTDAGRRFTEVRRHEMRRIAPNTAPLVREPSGTVELHCALFRRSLFDRIGPFEEKLSSVGEHADFSWRVRDHGGSMFIEPAAAVDHLLPKLFPFDLESLPFFYERWSRANNRASLERFRTKWDLPADDRLSEESYNWCNDRRYIQFRYFPIRLVCVGLRKLRRIARKTLQRLFGRVAVRA